MQYIHQLIWRTYLCAVFGGNSGEDEVSVRRVLQQAHRGHTAVQGNRQDRQKVPELLQGRSKQNLRFASILYDEAVLKYLHPVVHSLGSSSFDSESWKAFDGLWVLVLSRCWRKQKLCAWRQWWSYFSSCLPGGLLLLVILSAQSAAMDSAYFAGELASAEPERSLSKAERCHHVDGWLLHARHCTCHAIFLESSSVQTLLNVLQMRL